MKRFDCLKFLGSLVDEHMLVVTSLSTNAPFWFNVRPTATMAKCEGNRSQQSFMSERGRLFRSMVYHKCL